MDTKIKRNTLAPLFFNIVPDSEINFNLSSEKLLILLLNLPESDLNNKLLFKLNNNFTIKFARK